MSTIVQLKCISKKQSVNPYTANGPITTAIELEVPYDQDSIYWKLSGGTNLMLNTINPSAAEMFEVGSYFDLIISPAEQKDEPAPQTTKSL